MGDPVHEHVDDHGGVPVHEHVSDHGAASDHDRAFVTVSPGGRDVLSYCCGMRWACLLVLVACGGRTPPRPVTIANAAPPPDAAVEVDADDGVTCDPGTPVPILSGGVAGLVQLDVCMTGETSSSDQARADGFVEKQREARLVWTAAGAAPVTNVIASWTDGWEWGSSHEIAGVLLAPSGEGALLLARSSYGAAPGIAAYSAAVTGYTRAAGAWKELGTWSANKLDVTVAGQVATLAPCNEATDPATAQGCGGFPDADPSPTIELSYDGRQISDAPTP